MKDFGNEDYSGDCFDFVGKLNNLDCKQSADFIQIIRIINQDLNLGLRDKGERMYSVPQNIKNNIPNPTPKKRPYSVVRKTFSANEFYFWNKSGITEVILRKYGVVSLLKYNSINKDNKAFELHSSEKEPMFGYEGKNFIKVYRPYSSLRFLYGGEIGENYCFGLEQLPAKGDLLFITGGEKDVLSLVAHGFYAICFNSETVKIPLQIINKLSFRFKHIVILYDVDKTGLQSSEKVEQELKLYGVIRLLLPLSGEKSQKDVTDFFTLGHSHDDLVNLFLTHLDTLYSTTISALKSCEIDFSNPPPIAHTIISVNEVPLGTQGNLLCITGGEGTGKSNYVASLIAGVIKPQGLIIDTLGVCVSENRENKAVLFYDTEQSEVQLYKNITNLLRRSHQNTMPGYFKAYGLSGMSRKERLLAIIQSMDKFHYQYKGIQLVVIDGIADLVKCANDEAESIAVVEELYRLAGIYKTCIVCVLHFIPNGVKLRGHLGSELQRKAAAILSIEKDDEPQISIVKALKVRDGSPLDVPIMQFQWDKALSMHTYIGEKPKEVKDKRKEHELIVAAKEIFSQQRFLTYAELSEKLQVFLDVKDRTAKSYIKFMREKEIIIKDPANQTYFILGHL